GAPPSWCGPSRPRPWRWRPGARPPRARRRWCRPRRRGSRRPRPSRGTASPSDRRLGEPLLELEQGGPRYQLRDVGTVLGDLLDARAGHVRPAGRRHDERRLDVGVELTVQVRHLQLVLEVGDRAQALDYDPGADLPGVVGEEAVERVDDHVLHVGHDLPDDLHALLGREQRAGLERVVEDGHGQAVVDPGRAPDHVDVAVVEGVEAPRVDGVDHERECNAGRRQAPVAQSLRTSAAGVLRPARMSFTARSCRSSHARLSASARRPAAARCARWSAMRCAKPGTPSPVEATVATMGGRHAPGGDGARSSAERTSRRTRSAPGRSALFTQNTSPTSMIPALKAWTASPLPGVSTTTVVSAASATSTSDWPTPTVSITTTS